MLFNSIAFAFFFPIVFILYWFVFSKRLKAQNLLLVAASYFFYSCWDWRFVFLLFFSTLLDYCSGIMIYKANGNKARQKLWLILSIAINLGFLCFFKYYNFFIESFAYFLNLFHLKANMILLKIILPVGISFYTFHGLSYVFDIYNNKIKPTYNFANYTLFVCFFPLLVAGPIERATHLLPQVEKSRVFDYSKAVDGLKQILWGLFKKIVIADNCAVYANEIFNNTAPQSGSTLLLGALFFTFQIYGDFSGYTDIALGTARLMGFELLKNFNFPYFSRDIAEFWRRWHISLSSWFKDYLYIPLGGSRGSLFKKIRNTFIIFIVSGFWHGANWTFIIWGALNAIYFLPLLLAKKNRTNIEIVAFGHIFPSLKEFSQITITFILTMFAWIFFRAESLHHAVNFISDIFTRSLFTPPHLNDLQNGVITLLFVIVFMVIEWFGREGNYGIANIGLKWKRPYRWFFYFLIIFALFEYSGEGHTFIYFQF